MKNSSVPGKHRITSKVCRLLLFIASLMPILLLTQPALAQRERLALSLWLRDSRNNYNNEVRADQDNKFFLEVRNTGTTLITNIRLSVEEPEGWAIEIKPAEISSLSAGSLNTVDVNIKPVGKATKEGHQVTFIAESNEIPKTVGSFWITVKPAQFWIWVWIAAGVVVVAGFVLVYRRFGRQ